MVYLESITRLYISFDVIQCAWFTHKTKESHETDIKRIFWYLKYTKYNHLVFNLSKKIIVDWYVDADLVVLWVHGNPRDPIFVSSSTWFVVTFEKFPVLWVSKIQTYIFLYIIHSEYIELPNTVRDLLQLQHLIKEVIDNLVTDSKKL